MRENNFEQRINIAKGQVEALKNLAKDSSDCRKVIEQFLAADAALKSAMNVYLKDHLNHCLAKLDENSKKELERITDTLIRSK